MSKSRRCVQRCPTSSVPEIHVSLMIDKQLGNFGASAYRCAIYWGLMSCVPLVDIGAAVQQGPHKVKVSFSRCNMQRRSSLVNISWIFLLSGERLRDIGK